MNTKPQLDADARLRESENQLREILHTAMDGFWLVDAQGCILKVNEAYCQMSGYSRDELLAMNIADVEAAEASTNIALHMQKILTQGDERFETQHRRKDGSLFPVEISVQYKVGSEGGYMVAFLRDLTSRVRTELELREYQWQIYHMERVQAVSVMASSLAHEINQPLAGILSNAQAALRFMRNPDPDLDQIREILDDIVADDKRAGNVVSRLRAMLRKEPSASERLDINEAVQTVMTLARQDLLLHGVTARADLAGGLPKVLADRTQVHQVILNLLLNAGQAMWGESEPFASAQGRGGRQRRNSGVNMAEGEAAILVSTWRDETGQITVSVRDSGPGIPAEVMPKVFDPFFTTKPDGLGMGLAICRSIVTAHGGHIWADSPPGGGAVVSFTLKAEEANAEGDC
jgi:PAS domain S-box-containing protein